MAEDFEAQEWKQALTIGWLVLPPVSWIVFWLLHRNGSEVFLLGAHVSEKQFLGTGDALFSVLLGAYILTFIAAGTIWLVRRPEIAFSVVAVGAFWTVINVITWASLTYFVYGFHGPWNVGLSHLDAIDVAVGTLTTAGTSGLEPMDQVTRALITIQMVLDTVVFTIALALLLQRIPTGAPRAYSATRSLALLREELRTSRRQP